MLLKNYCEVKLTLRYFLSLVGTSKSLNRPGWAAQRSPHTLTLAHSYSLHPQIVDVCDGVPNPQKHSPWQEHYSEEDDKGRSG